MTLNGFNVLLAQQGAGAQDPNAAIKLLGYMAIFMVIMYLMMIAPQRKKAKQQEAMLKDLRSGDKVVTVSGIVGVVVNVKERNVSIRSADTKLEVLKSAIAEVTEKGGESSETKN